MNLWIAGKHLDEAGAWEFQGVFDSEDLAIAACRSELYFVAPAILNNEIADESTDWQGLYYPKVTA